MQAEAERLKLPAAGYQAASQYLSHMASLGHNEFIKCSSDEMPLPQTPKLANFNLSFNNV